MIKGFLFLLFPLSLHGQPELNNYNNLENYYNFQTVFSHVWSSLYHTARGIFQTYTLFTISKPCSRTYNGSYCLPHQVFNSFVQLLRPSEFGSTATYLYSCPPRPPPHGQNHLLSAGPWCLACPISTPLPVDMSSSPLKPPPNSS